MCSDLTADHLPLLQNMREKIPLVVREKFGVASNQLRLYFHYQVPHLESCWNMYKCRICVPMHLVQANVELTS